MSDLVSVIAVALAFGLLVTAHLALVVGLALRAPRWRAAVAFFVFPLAPYWGFRERMRVRSVLWAVGLVVYVASRLAASAG